MLAEGFSKCKTAAIVLTGPGAALTTTVISVPAGQRFAISYLRLDAAGAVNVTLKSGTTALSGLHRFAAAGDKEWNGGGFTILRGRAGAQRDFVIVRSADVAVDGEVTYYLEHGDQDYA